MTDRDRKDEARPQTGERRDQDIPPYPDHVAGERQVVRNWQIESGQNQLKREG